MKRALSNILIILVILPGLACGATACVDDPAALDILPCHEQASDVDNSEQFSPKIFKDCTGVELAQSGSFDFSKTLQPDLVKFVTVLWEGVIGKLLYVPGTQRNKLASTDNLAFQNYPAPYLTTQRLRL